LNSMGSSMKAQLSRIGQAWKERQAGRAEARAGRSGGHVRLGDGDDDDEQEIFFNQTNTDASAATSGASDGIELGTVPQSEDLEMNPLLRAQRESK